MAIRVLLNDGMDKEGIDILNSAGIETDTRYYEESDLIKEIGKYDGLVVRSKTKVSDKIIEAGAKGRLKFIGRAGVGLDNIDVDSATRNGVEVKPAPNGVTQGTAEHALALMFDVSRNIPQAHCNLTIRKIWKKKPFMGVELSGKTLGIIGCGRIGQTLSQIVSGLRMPVLGYDNNMDYVKKNFPESIINYVSLDELLRESDYISLHTGGKKVVIGERELRVMKESAILINASRPGNVDNEALYNALKEKRIAGLGLDVHEKEPKKEGEDFENRFFGLDNVVLTPHLGASTYEGQRRTSEEMARIIIDYFEKGLTKNP